MRKICLKTVEEKRNYEETAKIATLSLQFLCKSIKILLYTHILTYSMCMYDICCVVYMKVLYVCFYTGSHFIFSSLNHRLMYMI